jgi:hypothetical protein
MSCQNLAEIRRLMKAKKKKLTSQSRAAGGSQSQYPGQKATFKIELPHFAGGEVD